MRFTVKVAYLLQTYTYQVTTRDDRLFICKRQSTLTGNKGTSDPPERLSVILNDVPKEEVWGKSLASLYDQLSEKIRDYLRNHEKYK